MQRAHQLVAVGFEREQRLLEGASRVRVRRVGVEIRRGKLCKLVLAQILSVVRQRYTHVPHVRGLRHRPQVLRHRSILI